MTTQYEITKEEAVNKIKSKIMECELLTHDVKHFISRKTEDNHGFKSVEIASTDGVDINFETYDNCEYEFSSFRVNFPLGFTLQRLKAELKKIESCEIKSLFVDSKYLDFISKPIITPEVANWKQVSLSEIDNIRKSLNDESEEKSESRLREIRKIGDEYRKQREKEDRNLFLGICLIMGAIPFSVLVMAIFG